jgi:hypothetical protein
MAIDLVTDQWPFLFTRFDGEQSMSELEAYIRRVDAMHARREPYVGISYLKRYSRERPHLERIARWLKDSETVTRQFCLATGMVNNSVGFRFLLSSIFLIKPMPCPYHVCGSFDDAVAFVRRHATEHGLVLPAARRPWPDLP